ncbi:hypothetical protein JG688_00010821 [Phytophthora aleatoria]|uniref:Uncharacterized protein n=1 Tax=Phytophthora aleatoria TaxID=2496075 RepID=A0A8J5M1E7_9STRA|nr:hypothetical protein JG688_00010821 [Phytophthora aleatoria]
MGETTQDTRDGDLVAGLVECDVNGMRRAREARVETAPGAALLCVVAIHVGSVLYFQDIFFLHLIKTTGITPRLWHGIFNNFL